MNRATPVQHQRLFASAARWKKAALAVAGGLVFVLLVLVALAVLFPPKIKMSPEPGSRDVPVGKQLEISSSWLRGSIESVAVKEISLDATGAPVSEKSLEGKLNSSIFITDDGGPVFLQPDSRYEVTVDASLTELSFTGPERRQVTEHYSFQTITTPAPLFAGGVQVVELGKPIIVEFNTPIEAFSYEIKPQLNSTWQLDASNPTRAFIFFEGYEQGQKFELTINQAIAENGVTLQKPYTQVIATTDPLKVVFVPGDGEAGVRLGERPELTFSEDIRNPEIVESLVSLEPATLGGWKWVAPNKLEFQPLSDWTQGAKITIRLKGGTEGLRGVSGSYLRQDVESTFTTKPSKLIEANLAEQKVYLYDNDKLVRTIVISSGSKATPSLVGTYAVYAKAEKLDMRGEGYFAPNVPWVLMFNGDYTIHGNYWATTFGTPSSHGCIGMPVSEAQYLYDWTPVGTLVNIHY